MEKNTQNKGMKISTKCFLNAILVIAVLMIATYIATFFIAGGAYTRVENADGNLLIEEDSFHAVEGGIPFWKWILSPFLVLGAEGGGTLIAVVAFLLVIGGVFAGLEKCGLMQYMLAKLTHRFAATRYRLMAILILFFMLMGSLIGSFEECVPLVPIVVALAVKLGWDARTGVAMTLLAAGCGFAAGICNPFTVGVAQRLSGLPMFSGAWLRVVAFVLIYALLFWSVRRHAKRVEQPVTDTEKDSYEKNPDLDRGLVSFAVIIGVGLLTVLAFGFIPAMQDYTLITVAVMFLIAGIVSPLLAKMKPGALGKTFFGGFVGMIPVVFMILMASSIKYTLEEAHVLDTILHKAIGVSDVLPRWTLILFIYLIVLVMNFFIASGSAKAFMLIPLIMPMADIFGIPRQLCIMAFAFGDGFSNVLYPTNPALLISLGLADVGYGRWFHWTWKFQALNLVLTSALLLFGLAIGYC